MIRDSLRFEGFSAEAWGRLWSLTTPPVADARPSEGILVIVVDPDGRPVASLTTREGAVTLEGYGGNEQLPELCAHFGVASAVVVDLGALDELAARATLAMQPSDDYVAQWLTVMRTLQDLEAEGRIVRWPATRRLPVPSAAMARRALDLLLPEGRSLVLGVWRHQRMWTAIALRRSGGELDWIAGPDLIQEWTGPLGGDFRRDHRTIQRAVGRAMAPVHMGVFVQHPILQSLLESGEPGAWAKAIAIRDVIISPVPRYVHAAVAADAMRAATRTAGRWLGQRDLGAQLAPLLRAAREQLGDAGSLTRTLGFNPLAALAARLGRRP